MFLVLNNHSTQINCVEFVAKKIIEDFIRTFTHLVKISNGKIQNSLFTHQDLKSIMLNYDYGFNVWRNHSVDIELKRKFLSMCERQKIVDMEFDDEFEIRYANFHAGALQYAYKNGYALLSFATDKIWELPELNVFVDYIDDSTSEYFVLKNFYSEIIDDKKWLDNLPQKSFLEIYPNIETLFPNIKEAFPNLLFHDKALKQFENDVQASWYSALVNKLVMLNNACDFMNGSNLDVSKFAPRSLSCESIETINRFKDDYQFNFNGINYIIKHHLRYTGNNMGRIYFVPVNEKKCIVYSITTKLPTVSDPKLHV